ncbi:MAG: DUF134 domain-containing protein [Candidatus Omnitrophica bacterium]|jgi:predicted DNA-binding protein (UPF0251 family)|nr:DUF134 domain-containing protein [Candidatus Omnitrophota bacterium]MDD5506277.1 DUF134 domain-containing protein [Candidatus Omnitrophota bacterium]
MRQRGRPGKYRIVKIDPKISQFSPRGRPGRPDEVELKIDEFEALRLADYQGTAQKEAAKSMRISQQTFSRILRRARYLVAKGITTGSAIKIQGGQYIISTRSDLTKDRNNTINQQNQS